MLNKITIKQNTQCSMPQKLSSHLSRREDWQRSRSLSERLQTTLNVDEFFIIYGSHLHKRVPIHSIRFESPSLQHTIALWQGQPKYQHAVLVYADDQLLGQMTYTFSQPLSFLQKMRLKKVHSHLVFPLKNLLAFHKVSQLAARDPLTQLFNRTIVRSRIIELIHSAEQHEHTLMMIDLDNFKQVNDSEGHDVGDAILQQIAAIIGDEIDQHHTAIRYGGDEFLLILPHTSLRAAHDTFKRMQQRLCEHRLINRYDIKLSAGSVCIQPYLSAEQVLAQVDENMYAAKHAGGARHFYEGRSDVSPHRPAAC